MIINSFQQTKLQVDLNALQWGAENGMTLHGNKFQLFSFKKSPQLSLNDKRITNATFEKDRVIKLRGNKWRENAIRRKS